MSLGDLSLYFSLSVGRVMYLSIRKTCLCERGTLGARRKKNKITFVLTVPASSRATS